MRAYVPDGAHNKSAGKVDVAAWMESVVAAVGAKVVTPATKADSPMGGKTVTAVAVTTLRKILTVVMSFAFFPKPWSDHYAYGGGCRLVALILDARAHHARGGPPRSEADGRDTAGELQPMRPRTRAHPSDSEEEGAPLK